MTSSYKKINNLFYFWLLGSFFILLTIVIVGGLTRLTNSGLSITEWELFKGILPPLNIEKWNEYFSHYKKIPQYELINQEMTLNEFKIIYYWEYIHRILARIIGVFFIIPLFIFHLYYKLNNKYLTTCYVITFLILLQGLVGWYMVKSGLVNNVTVSHYRLSLHLSIAFIIISLVFWILLNLRNNTNTKLLKKNNGSYIFYFLIILLLGQIILGAFVSGLDAGRIYQTWPLMDKTYFPSDTEINFFKDYLDFDNQGLVQFYHRNAAYLIIAYIFFIGIYIYKKKKFFLIKSYSLLFFFLLIQIFLGVFTLTSGLNIYIAISHQICSLILILCSINLYYNYIK